MPTKTTKSKTAKKNVSRKTAPKTASPSLKNTRYERASDYFVIGAIIILSALTMVFVGATTLLDQTKFEESLRKNDHNCMMIMSEDDNAISATRCDNLEDHYRSASSFTRNLAYTMIGVGTLGILATAVVGIQHRVVTKK